MNISDYLRTALLNHALGVAAYTPPNTVWAGLYNTPPPTSAGGGTEVPATDYGRVLTSWGVASVGLISNSADIRFPASGVTLSNWGTVTAVGIFDSSSGGNLLFYGALSASVLQALGSTFLVPTPDLIITLS